MITRFSTLSRRRFLATSVAAAASASLPTPFVFSQTPLPGEDKPSPFVLQSRANAASAKITTQPLRGNVSALLGSGGNIAVLFGKEGKLLVDSGYSTSRPQITEALAAISPDPVTHLIDTHWHFDHTDGNEWLHASGATILAHENTKVRLSTPQDIPFFGAHFPAAPAGAIPTETFAEKHTLTFDGETLRLLHFSPAHTDSDISVFFERANVLHLGDTWFNGFYPFIDYTSGGSIDGMIRAAAQSLAAANDTTIIIPGHGPIGDKAQFSAFRDMLVGTRQAVAAEKKQGKSLDEVIAAKPTAPYDAKWGNGLVKPEIFTRFIFQGV